MNTDHLSVVLAVGEEGGVAPAARRLGLDPSAVSRALSGVEAALGFRIFQRTTRRLSATESGAAYLARLKPLLAELEAARDEAAALSAAPRGRLRLAASVAFGHERIAPHIGAFRAAFPELELELALDDRPVDLVAEAVDLAFRLAPAAVGDLIASRVRGVRYRVCASPGWAAANTLAGPGDLEGVECLRQTLPGFRDAWIFRGEAGDEVVASVGGGVLISNPLTLRRAAEDGLGPALLADWLAERAIGEGRLVDLFPDRRVAATSFDAAIWIVYPSRRFTPAKVRAAIDFFRPLI
ncbi:MAG: LysR family transcriptional regulator [Pseudomonadota bacterium]